MGSWQADGGTRPDFNAVPPAPTFEQEEHPALAALQTLDPDELSPREALDRLYALRRLLAG